MATIKSYTSLAQSRKLAEILPLESADMWWNFYSVTTDDTTPQIIHLDTPWVGNFNWDNKPDNVPCWSLAALLDVLSYPSLHKTFSGWRCDFYNKEGTSCILGEPKENPIDACVAMIKKLHEQNLL